MIAASDVAERMLLPVVLGAYKGVYAHYDGKDQAEDRSCSVDM